MNKKIKLKHSIVKMLKPSKKKLIILAFFLLFLTAIFVIPIHNGRTVYSILTYKDVYYSTLSAERQAVYDKMKIKYVELTSRKTGTQNFNTSNYKSVDDGSVLSNMTGIDVSEKDNYVRTFDNVFYTLEVGVEINPDADIPSGTVLKGGVIKVKATIPKGPNGEVLAKWNQDAWMNNYSSTDSYTTITAEYYIPEGQTAAGGNQNLTFSFSANGYVQKLIESGQKPTFEIWMEGNKPDNEASTAESIKITDENDLYITGKESYDIRIVDGKVNTPSEDKKGQYINYGLRVLLEQPEKGISGLIGVAYPNFTSVKAKIKFEYYYNNINDDVSGWTLIDENNNKSNGLLNGAELIAYNNDEAYNSNAKPFTSSNELYENLSNYVEYSYQNNNSKLTDNILDINITNMSIPSSITTEKKHVLINEAFELYIPYYEGNGQNEYQVKAIVTEFIPQNGKNENLIPDKTTYNNSRTENFLMSGDAVGISFTFFKKTEGSSYSSSDNMYIGGVPLIISQVTGSFGIYEGGVERLITWEPSFFEYRSSNVGNSSTIRKYGIYKKDKENGLSGQEELNTTTKEDFDWYTSSSEAQKNGKITAFLHDDKSWKGYGQQSVINLYFNTVANMNNIDKSTFIRQKVYLYPDAERTKVEKIYADDTIDSYIPDKYEGSSKVSSETPVIAGETVYIYTGQTDVTIRTNDFLTDGTRKTNYDVLNEVINYEVIPSFLEISDLKSLDGAKDDISITVEVPSDQIFLENTASIKPETVHKATNGKTYVRWILKEQLIGDDLDKLYFTTSIDPYIKNNTTSKINVYIAALNYSKYSISSYTYDGKSYTFENAASNDESVYVANLSGSVVRKQFSKYFTEVNESASTTNTIYNISENQLQSIKTIERLPYNGDIYGSKFNGNYTLKITQRADNQKVYYTTNSFDTLGIITDEYGNLSAKNIDFASDSKWIEANVGDTIPSNAVAIGTVLGDIESLSDKSFAYDFIPNNNKIGDKYEFVMFVTSNNLSTTIASFIKEVVVGDRALSGRVFSDRNDNNIFDTGDKLHANTELRLLNANKVEVARTTTNSQGYYQFKNLPKGNYYVEVVKTENTNFEIITKNAGKVSESNVFNSTGMTDLLTELNGELRSELLEQDNINLGLRFRKSTLKVNYKEILTNKELTTPDITTIYYGDKYVTTSSERVTKNYEVVMKTPNYEGIVENDYIEVTYYYRLKDSRVKTLITKVAPDDITSSTQENKYTIHFETQITDYLGDVNIEIVDKLPFAIDETKSKLEGGVYNAEKKTITWQIKRKNIDATTSMQTIKAIKYITLVYKDFDSTVKTVNNTVTSTITLTNNKKDNEAQDVSYVKIPGKIIVHHYVEGTTTKVADDVVTKNLVGEVYVSEPITKDGIRLISSPEEKIHIYQDGTQEIIYEYERLGYDIITKVNGNKGGTIEGDEFVPYGQSSTEDNIVIEPAKGYEVKIVEINGDKIDVTNCKYGCVLEAFDEMTENKEIIVTFDIANPETNVFGKKVFIVLGLLISSLAIMYIFTKKIKTQ